MEKLPSVASPSWELCKPKDTVLTYKSDGRSEEGWGYRGRVREVRMHFACPLRLRACQFSYTHTPGTLQWLCYHYEKSLSVALLKSGMEEHKGETTSIPCFLSSNLLLFCVIFLFVFCVVQSTQCWASRELKRKEKWIKKCILSKGCLKSDKIQLSQPA